MKNIVWLTEWFPSAVEPYAGDGIERRAKAASLYANVFIIYVKKKPGLPPQKIETEERVYNENCRVIIYYYPPAQKFGRWADVISSNYYFIWLHARALRSYRKKYGKPHGIQVNVSMKVGLIALFCKWLWGVQYIVVEGWSLYLPEAEQQFKKMSRLFRYLNRQVFRKASLLLTVSEHLGKMINRHIVRVPYKVAPSVVDTTIFFPVEKIGPAEVFRFIHISTLNHPKNFEQIVQAVKIVTEKGYAMTLDVYGPQRVKIIQLVSSLGLTDIILLKPEVPQEKLANAMHHADALILYSRYETFGNVIIEANACGLPVIVSDYPTFKEIITEGVNGLTAAGNDPAALAEKMIFMMEHYSSFNSAAIARQAKASYHFEKIGKIFDEVYRDVF